MKAPPRKTPNLSGLRFGRLFATGVVGRRFGRNGRVTKQWLCVCDCGSELYVDRAALVSGNTRSCGCGKVDAARARATHGQSKSRAYRIWKNMLTRCLNPNYRSRRWYSDKGVTVCSRWRSFAAFIADMGHPPDGTSIDRINPAGNYEPENCRWIDHTMQCRNRTNNRLLTFNGKTQCVSAWAEDIGLIRGTIMGRVRAGLSDADVLGRTVRPATYKRDGGKGMKRKKLSYSERLASVLLLMQRGNGTPLIPPEIASQGTKAILRHVEWDHIHPIGLGGDNHPTNLQALTKEDHLTKTKRDVKTIAKSKRLTKKEEAFRARLLAKTTGDDAASPAKRKSRWPKGRRLRGGAPLRSQPFPKR